MQLGSNIKSLSAQMMCRLIPAQILTVALVNATSFLNSLITGSLLGSDAVAAISFIQPVTLLIAMLAGGISTGSQVLCGQYIGRGDAKGANRIRCISLLWSLVLGILIFFLCRIFAEQIAAAMGAEGENLANAAAYLRGMSWGICFMLFSSSLMAFMQLDNSAKTAMLGSAALLIINVLLIFVFVKSFGMRLEGVGLATSMGYLALMLVGVAYYFSKKCTFKLRFRLSHLRESRELFYIGISGMCAPLALSLRSLVLNKLCFSLAGTIGVSAMGVFASLSSLMGALGGGVGGAAGILSSVFVGERNRSSLQEISPMAQKIAAAMHYSSFVVVFILAKPLAIAFGTQAGDMSFMIHAIRAGMTCMLFNSFTVVSFAIHNSMGHTWLVSICSILDYFVFQCLFAFVLNGAIGINAVWYASIFSELSVYAIMLGYYKRKSGRFPKLPFDYIYIPEEITVRKEDCFDMSMRTMEEVEEASQKVIELCRSRGMDSKRSYYCGLCIEEQASNIILHGFTKGYDKKEYSIELRLIFEESKTVISLRDNCVMFDPTAWCPGEDESDPMKGMGIKMVQRLAEDVSYHHTLGLNVLSVTI